MPSPWLRDRQRLYKASDVARFMAMADTTGLDHHILRGQARVDALALTKRPRSSSRETAGTTAPPQLVDAEDLVARAFGSPGTPAEAHEDTTGPYSYRYAYKARTS
jgi:hypothetical protein